jgi:hypothetical protein
MNTLDLLREKADRIDARLRKTGIFAVVRHIEMAERHFQRGKQTGDTDLFTDVVYRTNHAFEGILKEAYAILADKDPAKERPYDIENYLAEKNVFQARVTELFAHYRTKWRNPSTHDHVASYTESEAFLSILNVTAFVGILMDQILERLTFDHERKKARDDADALKNELQKHEGEPMIDRVTYMLQSFASHASLSNADLNETEMMAALRAFFESVAPNISVSQEPVIKDKMGTLRPDFLLQEYEERLIVEVRRYRRWEKAIQRRIADKVRRYMDAAGARSGIILAVPTRDAEGGLRTQDAVLGEHLGPDRMLVTIYLRPGAKHSKRIASQGDEA